ncbi:hypothetical protein [Mycobacteroides abscessus]|uniref:hypothetical protein n=1 Tax=Mycobacteroides abscessus TaxID=36809 RepID=UPI0012FFF54B|nr:hypothetical protein [Mycobacteroides abscessus]
MPQKKITELPTLSVADSGDYVPIVDSSANITKKVPASGIVSADSLDAAIVIKDNTVTNDKLAANAAWASWTPTFTNLSGGTLNYANYQQIGKTVNYRLRYTLAGAGVGTAPTFTLPVAANSDYSSADYQSYGEALYRDTSVAATFKGIVRVSSSTVGIFGQITNSSNNILVGSINASSPIPFASGDVISIYGTYEAA